MTEETLRFLHRQLVLLGDMMGDGLHLESDGKWIEREYKKILKAIGVYPKKDNSIINSRMAERIQECKCDCGGDLKQVRSGSFVAKCLRCNSLYKLLQRRRK